MRDADGGGGREALLQLLDLIASVGTGSFLAVLKQFGPGANTTVAFYPVYDSERV